MSGKKTIQCLCLWGSIPGEVEPTFECYSMQFENAFQIFIKNIVGIELF